MDSNDISAASARSTPPIHFLDFKKSTALGSVVSISSNILLVKVPANFIDKGSHRKVYQLAPSHLWYTGSVIDRFLGIHCEQSKWLPLTAKVTTNY
jgi:hypothetical protein